jgi:hypothetical protein
LGLLVRSGKAREAEVQFRDFWGQGKREDLLASLQTEQPEYIPAQPTKTNRHTLRPSKVTGNYLEWPKLTELAEIPPINGLMEKRAGALIDIDKAELEQRMKMYYDSATTWSSIEALKSGLSKEAAGFDPLKARAKVQASEGFDANRIVRYTLRPYETVWSYYSSVNPLWNRSRPSLWAQFKEGNSFLSCRPAAASDPEGVPLYFTTSLGDNDALRGHAYYFPLHLFTETSEKKDNGQDTLFEAVQPTSSVKANLSAMARTYLANWGLPNPDEDKATAELLWLHALAIGYSPSYLSEHADGIRSDWPRIPLPKSKEQLLASAKLGKTLAALLDTETPVPGVTSGALRPELKPIAAISRVGGGNLNAADLEINAGWGRPDSKGVVMPGKGKVTVRPFTPDETKVLQEAGLGQTTLDVYLNSTAYWRCVPERVWEYMIGGYQVLKKWLSYREVSNLERALTTEEAREVTAMCRRLAAIILLERQLDENYQAVSSGRE